MHRLMPQLQMTAIPGTMKQCCLIGLLSLGVKIFNQIVSLEAWACQKLEFVSGEKPSAFGKVGLVQKQNGPCGVLAVINAVLIQVLIENKKAHFGADYAAVNEDLGAAIHKIVSKSHIAIDNTLSVAYGNRVQRSRR